MKRVMLGEVLIQGAPQRAAIVLKGLVGGAAIGTGFSVNEVRQRVRVAKKLEADLPHAWIDLEDADHATLMRCVEQGSYTLADEGLLQVLDAVLQAKDPPPPEVQDTPAPVEGAPSAMALRN